ncbi:MAG: CRISPR-associated endoribonuclease Cas6 [Thermoproteota archaeon]
MRVIMQAADVRLNYNHLIQAAIYQNVSHNLANFLHERGFIYGKRHFKLFTFSRLLGHYNSVERGIISFDSEIDLYISSPIERFVREIANSILRRGHLILGDSILKVIGLEFPKEPEIGNEVRISMLSPVTVYSTLLTCELKKKTYYYSPYEVEFCELIDLNAKKKHVILHNKKIKSHLTIIPIKVREVIVMYKDTVVKSWLGSFYLKGPKTLIRTLYDTGLGSKNSQGFGMFTVT